MNNHELRQKLVSILGLSDASSEDQNAVIYRVESLAQKQFLMDLPDALSDEQVEELEQKPANEVMTWAAQQLPNYEAIMQDLLLDIAQSIAGA